MKKLLVLVVCLLALGCNAVPEALVIDPAFSAEDRAAIEEAVLVWQDLCPEVAPRLSIGDPDATVNVHLNCAEPDSVGGNAATYLAGNDGPDHISICPGRSTLNSTLSLALHEVGHMIRQDYWHADYAPTVLCAGACQMVERPSERDVMEVCGHSMEDRSSIPVVP